ncbi:right-handed parallel beta-helix repeat-containing protein [Mesorhizobium sp. L-8-3]|uniref:right-handed parallel beta-helix repeat-containing protein n=1 Tax=Mesorhizobium sp. L-8-3 TaxID=2744522 RepID=UPI001936CD16|nr:right-handed parallel beta-helix repeat-containing protein [Mesorhizobium sp. L-8-3]BCH27562.1 hypothetical protein MesoLjLb_73470 [Mesorhizobium sp. L-8-3]
MTANRRQSMDTPANVVAAADAALASGQEVVSPRDGLETGDAEMTRMEAEIEAFWKRILLAGQFASDPLPQADFAFPDASNTGVPAGTVLAPYDGPFRIEANDVMIENKEIRQSIRVLGSNFVMKNCRLIYNDYFGVDLEGATSPTIQDCTLIGPGNRGRSSAPILGSGTFLRNDISGAENGIVLQAGKSVVKGNYIHDLESGVGDEGHYDGISVQGAQNDVLIEDNTIVGRDTSDIFIKNDFGDINNVRVNHNLLVGTPGFALYVDGRGPKGVITNVSVTNNRVKRGGYGFFSVDAAAPTFSGNVDADTGKAISVRAG